MLVPLPVEAAAAASDKLFNKLDAFKLEKFDEEVLDVRLSLVRVRMELDVVDGIETGGDLKEAAFSLMLIKFLIFASMPSFLSSKVDRYLKFAFFGSMKEFLEVALICGRFADGSSLDVLCGSN